MLENLKPPGIRRSCKVSAVTATLSEADRDILLKAIADEYNWPIASLSRALQERGIMLSTTPITNHRAKACACFG